MLLSATGYAEGWVYRSALEPSTEGYLFEGTYRALKGPLPLGKAAVVPEGAASVIFAGASINNRVVVRLGQGWNLLTNPFEEPLAWGGQMLLYPQGGGQPLSAEQPWILPTVFLTEEENYLPISFGETQRLIQPGEIFWVLAKEPLNLEFLHQDGDPPPPVVVSQEEKDALVQAQQQFAMNLYREARKADEEGNVIFSPFNIAQTVNLLVPGAAGTTMTQISQVLHQALPVEVLPDANRELAEDLEALDGSQEGKISLSTGYAAWLQEGFPFTAGYRQALEQGFGAHLETLDFFDASGAANRVNKWVSGETKGLIPKALDPNQITVATKFILTGTLFFKGTWKTTFEKTFTMDRPFHLLSGESVDIPMMQVTDDTGTFPYVKGDGWQALKMSYTGERLSMLVILPDEGRFQEVDENLTVAWVNEVKDSLEDTVGTEVTVSFPRLELDSELDLKGLLQALGMKDPFSADFADFSRMSTEKIYLENAFHKTKLIVNEEGTEAAAVTGVGGGIVSLPPDPIFFTVNRPFIFLIQDGDDLVAPWLFMGGVLQPK